VLLFSFCFLFPSAKADGNAMQGNAWQGKGCFLTYSRNKTITNYELSALTQMEEITHPGGCVWDDSGEVAGAPVKITSSTSILVRSRLTLRRFTAPAAIVSSGCLPLK